MSWGMPATLLLLTGAIPLILFLHSLKPKGLRIPTTTLFLWERVLKERPLGTRMGWLLRKNILLILQLLAALALVAALADPAVLFLGGRSGDLVVVIDTSASMKARGKEGARFEAARREFFRLVDGLGADQKMLVIGAGAEPRLLTPFTSDKHRLRELGRGLSATDAAGRVKEAIDFAHAFLKRDSSDRVVVISDGAFAGAQEYAKPAAHLRFIKVEGGERNVAIVGFEARRVPHRPAALEIMVHVRNYTAKAARAPLTIALDGKVLVREEIEVGGDGRRVLIHGHEGGLDGMLSARLDIDDDFATDNQAYLLLENAPPAKVHYVGPGNPYLSHLLRVLPNVEWSSAPAWEPRAAQGGYDVVIFDRVEAPALPEGNFVLIDSPAPNLPLAVGGKVDQPRVMTPLAKHPLTEGLSLGDLRIQQASRVSLTGPATVLARARETPLLVALESDSLRALFLAFDLTASDLPLRVAFPVLFHNALQWFQPRRAEFPGRSIAAGGAVGLPLAAADGAVEIVAPSGRREQWTAASRPAVFTDTWETGVYTYKSDGRQGRFAVNLFDETESQIAPQVEVGTGVQRAETGAAAERGMALWPWLLAAVLGLLFVEIVLALRQGVSLYPVAARALALAAICLALINPRLFQAVTGLDVLLAVDLSRSVGQQGAEKARELLDAARQLKPGDVRTGLLAFGRAPQWEFLPRSEVPYGELVALIDREETDVQAALQASLAQASAERQQRVLLISDGNENRGEAARVVPLLRAQGVQVWTMPIGLSRGRNEVYLSDFRLPRRVDSAEGFEIRGSIESLRAARARVRLLRDGALHAERELNLVPGANPVAFRDSLTARGNHVYELLVESPDDTLAENNLLQGVVEVKGPPRVLLLSAQPESRLVISRVLQVQGYAVMEAAPERHALGLAELAAFDLLVLDNVPAMQLTHGKMENIEKYVRDLGGGLLVIGGSQSYGAGGYHRTPLERIMPVEMRPPARLEMPHVLLLFVIDKSGSMGAGGEGMTKLDLAKAAAIAAADIMNPTDQVGVLAFDANWEWTLPFQQVGRGEAIAERLATLQADGGTDLYKAMLEAERAMAGVQAAIKHVIVLSDGITDKADFPTLVAKMTRGGVTVSTVSVGADADVSLLAEIAKLGKGRGYVALDPQTVPQIFTTETLLISRDLLIEKPVAPTLVSAGGPLKGIFPANLPPLRGYVLTYPKARAELWMRAENDPLLVSWRYGLGRVMAFTSDLSGRWGREWVQWPKFPQWLSQIARDTLRKILEARAQTEFFADGEGVRALTDMISSDGKLMNHLNLRATLTAANQESQKIGFQQSAPGRYEARFVPPRSGIHFLTVYADAGAGAEPIPVATLPYIAPYPREYRELRPNTSLLSRLAEETGGEVLDAEKFDAALQRLYTPAPAKTAQGRETWWPLAGAGLFLFLADLVFRSLPRKAEKAAVAD